MNDDIPERWRTHLNRQTGRWPAVFAALLALAGPGPATAQAAASAGPSATPAARHARPARPSGLEQRVQILTRALDLDARQQAQLRAVLQAQRDQVTTVWNDASRSSAERVGATEAIGNQTADRIRALLTEEQRKKYNPPRPPPGAREDPAGRSVEDWMDATRSPPPPPATPEQSP